MLSARYRITDLGHLDGEVLLFGGVYSNAQALTALRRAADAHGIPTSKRICTGDIAGYCADTAAVMEQMVGDTLGVRVAGNVEKQLAAGQEDCGCGFEKGTPCDIASRSWFAEAQRQMTRLPEGFLSTLPDMALFRHTGKRYAVIHGGLRDVSRFIWPNASQSVFEDEFSTIEHEVGPIDAVIAGHCGIPFERRVGRKTWINAGVIGMPPHDGRPETRYAVLGEDGVRFHHLSYDHVAAAQAMREAGLTQGYEWALETGYWPSEDVLPAALCHGQGRQKVSLGWQAGASPRPAPLTAHPTHVYKSLS